MRTIVANTTGISRREVAKKQGQRASQGAPNYGKIPTTSLDHRGSIMSGGERFAEKRLVQNSAKHSEEKEAEEAKNGP